MNKRNWMLIALATGLAVVYVAYFTDWFRPKVIHISHTSRPVRSGARPGSFATPLGFSLGGLYEVTEITVVPLAQYQTNKQTTPIWHLVSASGSDSINHFFYGAGVGGMDPAVAGGRAAPLQPGLTYRLFVRAGSARGQHDFEIKPPAE